MTAIPMAAAAARVETRDGVSYLIDPADGPLEVKYGLPPLVRFCRKCVMSNQRPSSAIEFEHRPDSRKTTIRFDDDGVCDACRHAEKKDAEIDWVERERELRDLCDRFHSRTGAYDCLVPGSGGKDSVFASHVLKTKYGMRPLTVTWAPHLYTDVGWRNFQNWIHRGGFDNYLFTPDGRVHRALTRIAYVNLLHPFQPFIIGQKNFAPKMAARLGIPLVFYGENEAEYGNPVAENTQSRRRSDYFARKSRENTEIYFGGVPVGELTRYGVAAAELDPYLPATADELDAAGVEVRYLGYYLKWTPQECYYYATEHVGFEANTERTEGTYSKYNSIDDKTDGYHYWTTYIKFGIGRATYDAAQEIRNHHITREEGVALVHRFDGEFPRKYFGEFLDYLSLEEAEFFDIADRFRSPHLWRKTSSGWKLRHRVP
jgi:N-acetyl sugar amidotransferase